MHRIIVGLGLILVASTPAQAEDLSTEFDRVTTASWSHTTGIDKLMRAVGDDNCRKSFSLLSNAFEHEKSLQIKKESAMCAFTEAVNAVDHISRPYRLPCEALVRRWSREIASNFEGSAGATIRLCGDCRGEYGWRIAERHRRTGCMPGNRGASNLFVGAVR